MKSKKELYKLESVELHSTNVDGNPIWMARYESVSKDNDYYIEQLYIDRLHIQTFIEE